MAELAPVVRLPVSPLASCRPSNRCRYSADMSVETADERSPEFYLSRMGLLWLSMVACFAVGLILWFVVGLGVLGFAVGVVPLSVLRGRWDRLRNRYYETMLRSGREPVARDWPLIGESLVHAEHLHDRRPRPRSRGLRG